ncbi:capsule biosynthesis GfcC family protein [Stenotrophomonas sp. LM091]|uniref:capsule biosynthesis GfcC family protein n=1 Tax=Stenotrophomonas sp. LM091 TaxID=1904944 RepID=UPI0015607FB1|nr:capsule biosynthesis GfcC family protein [Stenotrophomonas sp. LM091]
MITLRLVALVLCAATSFPLPASPLITVEVTGSVRNPGSLTLVSGARLSDAALIGAPDEDSYVLGAALLRRSELVAQTRLKTGLLFDLDMLESRKSRDPAAAAAATYIANYFSAMPVTGRAPQVLAPRTLEMDLRSNRPLIDGDKLYYPTRPNTITVLGAVEKPCTIPHRPLAQPLNYARHCAALAAASQDTLFVIQPDGHVERLGIALWNRSPSSTLAPGALIYVPLSQKALRAVNPDFNEDAARFLATQVLDAPGALK